MRHKAKEGEHHQLHYPGNAIEELVDVPLVGQLNLIADCDGRNIGGKQSVPVDGLGYAVGEKAQAEHRILGEQGLGCKEETSRLEWK